VRRRQGPGARGRIGVIQPAPGVMLEAEWPAYLPPDTLFPVGRIRLPAATLEGYDLVAAQAPETARDLASAGADLIAYACTVGSLYAGPDAEAKLVIALAEASGRPAISLAETCIRALERVGVQRPALITPYDAATNRLVSGYAEAHGLAIAATHATPVSMVTVGDLNEFEIAALCIEKMADSTCADGLWLPCTAMRTLDAIPYIEALTGRPVISGVQALLWRALDLLELGSPSRNAGRLFG
jgi:maleate isomerase